MNSLPKKMATCCNASPSYHQRYLVIGGKRMFTDKTLSARLAKASVVLSSELELDTNDAIVILDLAKRGTVSVKMIARAIYRYEYDIVALAGFIIKQTMRVHIAEMIALGRLADDCVGDGIVGSCWELIYICAALFLAPPAPKVLKLIGDAPENPENPRQQADKHVDDESPNQSN